MRAGEPTTELRAPEGEHKSRSLTLVGGAVTTASALVPASSLAGTGTGVGFPLDEALHDLVPHGALPRGTSLAVHGSGATSFALSMVAAAAQQGAFIAVVASRTFGLGACVDFGVPLRRVVQFDLSKVEGDRPQAWSQVVAALIDGFEIVLLADHQRISARHARQLTARNRERGSLIARIGGPAWHEAPDFRFDVTSPAWAGLGQGHGHLRSRQVSVQVAGRRHKGAPRSHQLLLPALQGGVAVAPAEAPVSRTAPADEPGARFAGSDIDAMLDAVDRTGGAAGSDSAAESGGEQDHSGAA